MNQIEWNENGIASEMKVRNNLELSGSLHFLQCFKTIFATEKNQNGKNSMKLNKILLVSWSTNKEHISGGLQTTVFVP